MTPTEAILSYLISAAAGIHVSKLSKIGKVYDEPPTSNVSLQDELKRVAVAIAKARLATKKEDAVRSLFVDEAFLTHWANWLTEPSPMRRRKHENRIIEQFHEVVPDDVG